jgi:hypothetical protein
MSFVAIEHSTAPQLTAFLRPHLASYTKHSRNPRKRICFSGNYQLLGAEKY